ncbi:MAG: DUF5053 domain-containing protein [Tannerella sp.]|jgi:hypothetical protein|nr:DUF5053 domain-containing protein [Tannerella sp.]
MNINQMMAEYHQASDSRKKKIETLIGKEFCALSDSEKAAVQETFLASLDKKISEADTLIREVNLKIELENVSKYVSMSYIAQRFFGKSRQWLNNRIKGNLVNGKVATFSADELNCLSSALMQLSGEIKNTALRITG